MAGQVGWSLASIVANEIVGTLFSELFRKRGKKQATPDELLQQLEMLLIKIHSAVEVSEKHSVESPSLLQWKEKLKEAASHGDEVLLGFKQRAMAAQPAGDVDQQRSTSPPPPPSTAAAADGGTSSASSFARAAVLGMAHGMRDAISTLFSSDEDMKKLKSTVERLEKASTGIGEFVKLLQVEVLPKEEPNRPTKRRKFPRRLEGAFEFRPCRGGAFEFRPCRGGAFLAAGPIIPAEQGAMDKIMNAIRREIWDVTRQPVEAWIGDTAEYQKFQPWKALLQKLSQALGKIAMAAVTQEGELKDSQWLSQWNAVLWEASQRGGSIRANVRRYLSETIFDDGGKTVVECDHGIEDLQSLVSGLEILVGDAQHFSELVKLHRVLVGST